MLTTLGFIFAFINSISASIINVVTQQHKIDPPVLAMYKGFGIALLMVPFVIIVPYPTNPMFYMLVIANGIFASISSRRGYEIINKYGAEISSKLLTVPPVLVAITWWIIKPVQFTDFINSDPIKSGAAIFCLIGMIFTIFAMGHNKHTKEATLKATPTFFFHTIQTFLFFFAVQDVTILQAIFHYMWLQGLIIGIMNYFVHVHHLKGHVKDKLLITIFDKKILKGGLTILLLMIVAKAATSVAIKWLPNPSYVVFIGNLQIIWVYIIDRFIHLKNTIPPTKGLILAIYAVIFILLTY